MAGLARSSRRARVNSLLGALTVSAVFVFASSAIAGTAKPTPDGTQSVVLHNNTSGSIDCPSSVAPNTAYWHFVIAPNNGTYSFVTISLNVGGVQFAFTGSQIIRNGSQIDNVFIEVPADYVLGDLRTSGSSAVITPAAPAPKNFNLSGTCPGVSADTTTPPTIPATNSTSTTTTSTTVPPTTSTSTTTTSTTAPTTTTTTSSTSTTTTSTTEPTTDDTTQSGT